MKTLDLPKNALAVLPEFHESRKIRLFAADPTILEAYLIFRAFVRVGAPAEVRREGEPSEMWGAASESHINISGSFSFDEFCDSLYNKQLSAFTIVDVQDNFSFFDWDDRYFIVGGNMDFLSDCHPMPLSVGRMHFESVIRSSADSEELLVLWKTLEPLM